MKLPSSVPKVIAVNRTKKEPKMPGLLAVEFDEAMKGIKMGLEWDGVSVRWRE